MTRPQPLLTTGQCPAHLPACMVMNVNWVRPTPYGSGRYDYYLHCRMANGGLKGVGLREDQIRIYTQARGKETS